MKGTPILSRSPFKPEGNLFDPSPIRKRGKHRNSGNNKPKAIDLDLLNNEETIDKFNSTIKRYNENDKENMDPQWSNTHSPMSTFSFSDEMHSNLSNESESNKSDKSGDSKKVIEQGIGRLNFECFEQDAPSSALNTFRFAPPSVRKMGGSLSDSPLATYNNDRRSSINDNSDSMSDDDSFRIPPLHVLRQHLSSDDSDEHCGSLRDQGCNYFEERKNNERKIAIAPSVQNIFLQDGDVMTKKNGRKSKRSTSIWVSAFQERPRYMTDFEQEGIMGEGSFSTVFKSRSRLDGCVYAIKKLKRKMTSTNAKMVALKEVCALAALSDCPRLVRYYGCWIEDSHLWIQTELCLKITLDIFVSQASSKLPPFKNTSDFSVSSFDSVNLSLLSPSDDMKIPKEEEEDYRCDPVVFLSCPKTLDFRCEDITLGAGVDVIDREAPKTPKTPCSFVINSNEDNIDNGSFNSPVREEGRGIGNQFPEELGWIIAKQVSEALEYMHRKGVAHLDIRPSNIFIGSGDHKLSEGELSSKSVARGLLDGKLQIKVGDLGMCCRLKDYDAAIEGESRYCAVELMNGVGNIPAVPVHSVASIARSSSFFEPSNYERTHSGLDLSKADMFSLGASLFELCKGSPLASDGGDENSIANSEWHLIRTDKVPMEVLTEYSPSFQLLVISLMSNDPSLRPCGSEVLSRCSTARHNGTVMMHTPSQLNNSMLCNSPLVHDPMAELQSDCVGSSTISPIDSLQSVLNDHRGVINNISSSSSSISNSNSSNLSRAADDIILDAASAIDRLVFELKSLRREQHDRQNRVGEE